MLKCTLYIVSMTGKKSNKQTNWMISKHSWSISGQSAWWAKMWWTQPRSHHCAEWSANQHHHLPGGEEEGGLEENWPGAGLAQSNATRVTPSRLNSINTIGDTRENTTHVRANPCSLEVLREAFKYYFADFVRKGGGGGGVRTPS